MLGEFSTHVLRCGRSPVSALFGRNKLHAAGASCNSAAAYRHHYRGHVLALLLLLERNVRVFLSSVAAVATVVIVVPAL